MAKWNSEFNSRWKRDFRRRLAERFGCRDWEFIRCFKCKRKASIEKGRTMEIHHINSYSEFPEMKLEIENVVPMCNACHDKFHSKYDIRVERFVKKVATAEDLQTFLNLKANYILNSLV